MHVLACHIPAFIRSLKLEGLKLRYFSTSSLEKKNHQHVRLFFGKTTMGGGKTRQSPVKEIQKYENRQVYFLIHKIPTSYFEKTIEIDK